MRVWLAARCSIASVVTAALLALGCKSADRLPERGEQPSAQSRPVLDALPEPRVERPLSSAVVAVERQLQRHKLQPPARRGHLPRLAFGRGVLARLRVGDMQIFDASDFRLLETVPVDGPRAVVSLADGALLVIGAHGLARWEPGKPGAVSLPRPVLLPGAEVYADARAADVIWVLDGGSAPPTLSSFRLAPTALRLLLPEQVIEVALPRGGTFGTTREGVWIYVSGGHAERFAPGGGRLPSLAVPPGTRPDWLLPAKRLDQSIWVTEAGHAARVLVSPRFESLTSVELGGPVIAADVGNEGQLLAAIVVVGAGPRFELQLHDQRLAQIAVAPLRTDLPTGPEDWAQVVTRDQEVVVAPRQPRVAVGGPDRLTIYDERATVLFSIPSE